MPPGHTALDRDTRSDRSIGPPSTPSDRFTLNTDFCGVAFTVNGTVSSTMIATGTFAPIDGRVQVNSGMP